MNNKIKNIITISLIVATTSFAQVNSQNQHNAFVDKDGVMRWSDSKEEVSLFGVNYTLPFAYSYRAHKKLGLSLKQAIDLDVAQMKRLGLTAFRVHVWDREISDKEGNVLQNEHLDLFDYLIAKLSENGIKSIITPIAWWGTGWPEPDPDNPGFSQIYSNSKVDLITKSEARTAERNYLKQFINYVNPYTKYSYKDDPSVIAIEIINEPHHPDDSSIVTSYINEMYDVLRNAGLTKPIFYNISENWNDVQANAVTKSKVEGVSFQWYPTALVHNKKLEGNYLINVNKYDIPSKNVFGIDKKAKMVYEFDAADAGGSYMYPAMARSYREAGMQFATMFCYDPVQIAWSNTEYPTHYLNLLYTPSKAISLMIAAKVFQQISRKMNYGNYPQNNSFGNFRVSYDENLSELNSETEFIYSNNTSTVSNHTASLNQIAGTGNSNIVQYNGTGAYFLDKLEKGIWKLEIYPDVLWIRDPFEKTSMSRQVARLFWNKRKMKINLPDLGEEFKIYSFSENKLVSGQIKDVEFSISPGIYLLSKKEVPADLIKIYLSASENFLNGLYKPENEKPGIYVVNDSPVNMPASGKSDFIFKIAGDINIDNAELYIKRLSWRGFEKHHLKNIGGFDFITEDSLQILQPGIIEYCVAVKSSGKVYSFPRHIEGSPDDWDFLPDNLWSANILSNEEPIVLADADRDRNDFILPAVNDYRRYQFDFVNGSVGNNSAVSIKINSDELPLQPFGFQLCVSPILKSLSRQLKNYNEVVIKGRSIDSSDSTIKLILLTSDGKSYSSNVKLGRTWGEVSIPIQSFKSDDALILPNSYPKFLPKIWKSTSNEKLTGVLEKLEFVQLITGQKANNINGMHYEIESIYIKK